MNSLVYASTLMVVVLVVGATPEAPFNRFNSNQPLRIPQRQTYNSRFLRLETEPAGQAPYPAAGYRPQGEQFRLPTESFPLRRQQQQSGQPDAVYGPPEVATEEVTTETDVTTTEIPTTTEMPTTTEYIPRSFFASKSTKNDEVKEEDKEDQAEATQEFSQEGVYYIYHPDGLLQRVVYSTTSEDMGYTARLTYRDVKPIKEPIYTYDPKTLAFTQITV